MDLHEIIAWSVFSAVVIILLALDLGVFHKRAHEIKTKEAILWSIFWTVLAFIFNIGVYLYYDEKSALQFFTCYITERSLSFDNIFVFIIIFQYFAVDPRYQHRVLFWGILGALVLRGVFIFAGVALVNAFHPIMYVFGAFLVITAIRMLFDSGEKEMDVKNNRTVKIFKKFMGTTDCYDGQKFFVKQDARWLATPLFVVLIVIDVADVIFAVDSVPAVLGISQDLFIVFTSNVFSILGLRALYFAFAAITRIFYYLKYGLVLILLFIGVKMLVADLYRVENLANIPAGTPDWKIWLTRNDDYLSLGVITLLLTLAFLASIFFAPKKQEPPRPPEVGPRECGTGPPPAA
jgi:tellurite resistance protein TerC